jgi:sulfur carrier protein ThiS
MADGITVEVRLSGRLGARGTRRVQLAQGATARDLVAALAPELGLSATRLDGVAVAVGGEIAGRDRPLRDGESVAVVLPVAGG